ncbi:non-homologous end-joining factor 1 [Pelobates cultripes]|uniref:Non-homologous end-joining factor 1 n=1 Tax=Pelobates cultripes TaxID=61616 RepID=A0AAD1SPQ7_PELCU|nr:non-homologous end-joining factor 1 [Pelobates cultripes]
MALSHEMDAHLLKQPWKSMHIGEHSFLGKVHFTDSSYALLLSDLSSVWCEEADVKVIEERAKELNKRLKAPISSFLGHLSQLMLPLLNSEDKGATGFSCCWSDGTLTLKVKSQLSGLPFVWDFHCKEASVNTVCRHFLRPLMSMTEALDQQCQELRDLLGRKDAEIQDYQESGAVLTLGRLKTESFDEISFNESFLTQVQKQSCPRKTLGFSFQLEQLYTAVTAVEGPPCSVDGDLTHTAGLSSAQESAVEGSNGVSEKASTATQKDIGREDSPKLSQVTLMSQKSIVQVSKAKKRKAKGLFT